MTSKVPISLRALTQRINRKLKPDYQQLKTPRGDRLWRDLGQFYILDYSRNTITAAHVNPEALGRELGCLQQWEEVVE